MTIVIPSAAPTFLGAREYAGRAPIQAPDWGALCEANHYMFAHGGEYLGGRVWPEGVTTDFDDVICAAVPDRILTGGWELKFLVYGQDVSIDFAVENIEDGTTLSTETVTNTILRWSDNSATYTDAEIRDDGTSSGDLTLIFVTASSTMGGSGEVYQVAVMAQNSLASADIPVTP